MSVVKKALFQGTVKKKKKQKKKGKRKKKLFNNKFTKQKNSYRHLSKW